MPTTESTSISEVVKHLSRAQRVLFITGAGMSADSGLPTYRGVGGLYNDEHADEGMPIEMVLSAGIFETRPDLTWKHLARIEAACRDATFNRGHEVMALLAEHVPEVWILTQNVDGFHHLAGSKNIIDIHGDIHQLICTHCDYSERVTDFSHLEIPPACGACGSLVRPDVVLFDEALSLEKIQSLKDQIGRGFDMVFVVGTSALFPYIIQPVALASALEIPTVEINPGTTDLSNQVDYHIKMSAAEALDQILKKLIEKP